MLPNRSIDATQLAPTPGGRAPRALCLDPGTVESGAVVYCPVAHQVSHIHPATHNRSLLREMLEPHMAHDILVVEMVASYGMPVGRDVFETCAWVGRFIQASGKPYALVYRTQVKLELCGTPRAKDANVRQAVHDSFEGTGGGATPTVGTKAAPGPLYGLSRHAVHALAAGLTWARMTSRGETLPRLGGDIS